MLQSHRPMMDEMRTAVVLGMSVRTPGDPMWEMLDAPMVRLMEQEQRQMDRMAGGRPFGPSGAALAPSTEPWARRASPTWDRRASSRTFPVPPQSASRPSSGGGSAASGPDRDPTS